MCRGSSLMMNKVPRSIVLKYFIKPDIKYLANILVNTITIFRVKYSHNVEQYTYYYTWIFYSEHIYSVIQNISQIFYWF